MCMECRRRALMQSGTWLPLLNITNNCYYDAVLDSSDSYILSTKLSLNQLVGSNSEYVLAVENNAINALEVSIYIIPRENIADADIFSVVVPVKLKNSNGVELSDMVTGNMAHIGVAEPDVHFEIGTGLTHTGTSSYRSCYYISSASSAPFSYTINSNGYSGGDLDTDCPAGGSHVWEGRGNYPVSDPCQVCGTAGYVQRVELYCSNCGEWADKIVCTYCGAEY